MTEQNLYQIELDEQGALIVNAARLDLPTLTPDQRLMWALDQVTAVHASLPQGSAMRVEVLDAKRPRGVGIFATDIPYGQVLTMGMVRANADRSRVRMWGDNPTGEVYPVDHAPLWPSPYGNERSQSVTPERTWKFGDASKLMPYTPKEPLPQIEPRERPQRERPHAGRMASWSTRKKAVVTLAGVVVVGGGATAISSMTSQSEPYSQVCVNNLSLQRLTDEQCVTPDAPTQRWWYVTPGKKVPAVGDYVNATTGTFLAPKGDQVSINQNIPTSGVKEKPAKKG